jgi:hypothetical protein
MYIVLFDRGDRLGANLSNYLAQILYAHKNKLFIKFKNNSKDGYRFGHSIFVKILFNYIDKYNEQLSCQEIEDDILFEFENNTDFVYMLTVTLRDIQNDFINYFNTFIYDEIKSDILEIRNVYSQVPFDVNKTILVHLRLDDTVHWKDYDGSICSNYYKNKIKNREDCYYVNYLGGNSQAPISNERIQCVIDKAMLKFTDYKVLLITSPISDTSFFNYDVIKSHDESYDLYLLSLCKVVILSRSTYSISSLFFNNEKDMVYLPLWGHAVSYGFDTIYDNNDPSKYEYFY